MKILSKNPSQVIVWVIFVGLVLTILSFFVVGYDLDRPEQKRDNCDGVACGVTLPNIPIYDQQGRRGAPLPYFHSEHSQSIFLLANEEDKARLEGDFKLAPFLLDFVLLTFILMLPTMVVIMHRNRGNSANSRN